MKFLPSAILLLNIRKMLPIDHILEILFWNVRLGKFSTNNIWDNVDDEYDFKIDRLQIAIPYLLPGVNNRDYFLKAFLWFVVYLQIKYSMNFRTSLTHLISKPFVSYVHDYDLLIPLFMQNIKFFSEGKCLSTNKNFPYTSTVC